MSIPILAAGLTVLALPAPIGPDPAADTLHLAQASAGPIQIQPGLAPEPDYLVGFNCEVAENDQGWATDIVIRRDRGGAIPDGVQVTWIVPLVSMAGSVTLPERGPGRAVRVRNVLPPNTEATAGCIVGQ